MAIVSITEAAKLAGVSRNTLYRSYINKGVLTVSRGDKGRKGVDTAELLRVFGALQSDSTESDKVVQDVTPKLSPSDAVGNDQVKLLQAELRRCADREDWYRQQINELTQTVKLLQPPARSRRWWELWR